MNRRMGRFRVQRHWLDDNLGPLIYRDIVPLEVRYGFDFDGWDVLGMSEQFSPIERGKDAPRYDINFEHDDPDHPGKPTGVHFVRSDPAEWLTELNVKSR